MQLKYDMAVGALYIRLSREPIARTREFDDNTNVDLDQAGGIVGIEVISVAHAWALEDILRTYSIPEAEVAQLRAYFLPGSAAVLWPVGPEVSTEPVRAMVAA